MSPQQQRRSIQMLDHQSASEPQRPLTGKAAIYTRPEQLTIYEDVGVVSGRTPMMSREGLRALVTAIEQGSIQSILVADESCLVQDADILQISLFLKACFEHDVVVVTSQTVYDFTNPALVTRFRSRCRQGRVYRERQGPKKGLTRPKKGIGGRGGGGGRDYQHREARAGAG